jgi:hypothetical protein
MYKDDCDRAREFLTHWWAGESLGRPACLVIPELEAPREGAVCPAVPEDVICPRMALRDIDFRVNYLHWEACRHAWLGEALPAVRPVMGPGSLALYLGCAGHEEPDTVWFEPVTDSLEKLEIRFDPDNAYWKFQLELHERVRAKADGNYWVEFPDLVEGLDILASMRGSQELLMDLYDRPEWVGKHVETITSLYPEYYNRLYDIIRDEQGGSVYWLWGPGKVSKLQCDISAMISPDMFKEYMVPVLEDQCSWIPYSLYHLDGPSALPHLDALVGIDDLKVIQWVAGAGIEPNADPRWYPTYHKIIEHGKGIFIHIDPSELPAMKKEFGPKLERFCIRFYPDPQGVEACEALLRMAETD